MRKRGTKEIVGAEGSAPQVTRRSLRLRRMLRKRLVWRVRKVAAIAATAALLVTGGVAGISAASAAGQGPGFGSWPSSYIGWEGGFVAPDGSIVYCFEPGRSNPTGATTDGGVQGAVTSSSPFGSNTVSGDTLARINRVVTEYGQTWDNVQASAVSFVVKHLANPNAMYQSSGWNGSHDLNGFINWKLVGEVGSGTVGAIQASANAILGATEGTVAGATGAGTGSVTFDVDRTNHYNGEATIRLSPTSATATVTLTNGVFADSGSSAMAGLRDGQTVAVRGVAPTQDGEPYKVSASGQADLPGGFAGNVRVWYTSGEQSILGPGERAAGSFTFTGEDPTFRTVKFQPVVTTLTGRISADGRLVDTLTFGTAADADGLNNPWASRQDGSYHAVAFDVTAYGPFDEAPELSDEVPADAPVVETVTVVSGPEGPNSTVEAAFSNVQPGGIYTFVAEYNADATPAITKLFISEGYAWAHGFGMADETTVVPMAIDLSSQIAEDTIALSGESVDTVIVENQGIWLKQDGEPVDVVLRGEYVHVPAAEDGTVPAPSDTLPDGATVIATRFLTVNEPGAYTIEDAPTAIPVGSGYMTWRWSLQHADQPATVAGWALEEFEQYLDPTQTQEILLPEISTKAQAGSRKGGTAFDTAIVGGAVPATGAVVTFEAYNVPADTLLEDTGEVCVPDNLVFSNVDDGQTITEPGKYPSPSIDTPEYAKTLWVESLWTVPADGEDPELIDRGECGVLEETTFTVDVTTQIKSAEDKPTVKVGEQVWDTSETRGWVPEGGSHVYHVYTWQGSTPVCDDSTLIGTVTSKHGTLTGGLYPADAPLVEDSEPVTVPTTARGGHIGFVEELVDESGRTVSIGECGDVAETKKVDGPPLAATGGGVPLWVPVGGAALLTAGIGIGVYAAVRRRQVVATA